MALNNGALTAFIFFLLDGCYGGSNKLDIFILFLTFCLSAVHFFTSLARDVAVE